MKRFRHEYKYLINYPELEELRLRMKPYFALDPHAEGGEYMIRSLYFDDVYSSDYDEKATGILFRKK